MILNYSSFMGLLKEHYLSTTTAEELARKMIYDVYNETGITATAGIGTNLFLAKVAMDIVAKKMQPDKYGVRIASLDEMSYRKLIWTHRPLTDIWRVGKGIARKLVDCIVNAAKECNKNVIAECSYAKKVLEKI